MSTSDDSLIPVDRRLAAAIDELSDHFVLFDADDRIVLANKAWRELNAAILEYSVPGITFEEHLRAAMKAGLIPAAVGREEEWLAERLHRHRHPQGPFELERQDGRWILVHEQQLANHETILVITDITEQKRVETVLRQSDERFQAFFKYLPAKMHIKDPDGRYILINPVSEKLFGVSNEDAEGKTVHDIFPEQTGEKFDAHDKFVLATGTPSTVEEAFPGKDGDIIYLTVKFPINDSEGGIAAVGASGIDITERKEIERLLQKREQELNSLVESSPDNIIRYDTDCRAVFVNHMIERTVGLTPESILGKMPMERLDQGIIGLEQYQARLEHVIGSGESDDLEIQIKLPDGELKTHHIILVCERNSAGDVIGALAFGRDITDRKRAEEDLRKARRELEQRVEERTRQLQAEIEQRNRIALELKKSEERFRDIAASSSDWFWEMGPDLRFSYVDETFGEITGIDPKIYLGRTRRTIAGERAGEPHWQQHLDDLDNHRPFRNFQYEFLRDDGASIYLSVSGTPVFNEEGHFQGYRGAGSDVTERVESERRLIESQEELLRAKEEAEKASHAKSDFLASMSHELRTPMNAILGFAQLLELDDDGHMTASQHEYVKHILDSGEHLLNLIADVLELNKIEEGQLSLIVERVAIKQLIDDCLQQIRYRAEANEISVINECVDDDLPSILSDETRLKQVMLIFLSNAIKYNRPGGSIMVACEPLADRQLRISVSDTGEGIPEDRREHLFTPFDRLGREGGKVEGTGIGLTIAKRIIENLEGTIGYQSRHGEGSTFWIEIPYGETDTVEVDADFRAMARADRDTMSGETAGSEHLVLYIEDNPANMRLMENIVGQFPGINMLSAFNAEMGLDLARQHQPDLIFMDINLPGMNGIEALQVLQECKETAAIPVVAISADAMPHDIDKAMDSGFRAYITKPINVGEIHRVLSSVIEAKSLVVD